MYILYAQIRKMRSALLWSHWRLEEDEAVSFIWQFEGYRVSIWCTERCHTRALDTVILVNKAPFEEDHDLICKRRWLQRRIARLKAAATTWLPLRCRSLSEDSSPFLTLVDIKVKGLGPICTSSLSTLASFISSTGWLIELCVWSCVVSHWTSNPLQMPRSTKEREEKMKWWVAPLCLPALRVHCWMVKVNAALLDPF